MNNILLTLLCVPVLFTSAQADELDDVSADIPIVTSASRLAQSVLKSPSAVTVIDRAMIEASGFIEIADIFRLVPGFQVVHADGQIFSVNAHGFGWEYPNRLQLLVDGRSTYSPSLSAIDWNTLGIHIEDIEKIEVVRGPASSAYGSNSFSGAINIITRIPALDNKLYSHARFGNKGERELLLKHSNHFDRGSFRITAATRDNDGFDDESDERDFNDISFSGHFDLNQYNSFDGYFSYLNGSTGGEPPDPDLFFTDDSSIRAWSGHIRWNHILSANQDLMVQAYHNYRDVDDMVNSYFLSDIIGTTPENIALFFGVPDQQFRLGERTSRGKRTDIEAVYTQINDSGIEFVAGVGGRYDTLASKGLFPQKGTVSDTSFRVFGNIQIPIQSQLTAHLGAVYENSRIDTSHLSPRVSLNWALSPRQSIRTSFSRAYRIPSLLEKNIETNFTLSNGVILDAIFVSGDNIKAETVNSFDIGYLGRLSHWPISWELKAYKEEYDDILVFVRDFNDDDLIDNSIKRVRNEAHFNVYGFEGEITFRPQKNSFIRYHFNQGHGTGKKLQETNKLPPAEPDEYNLLSDSMPRNSYGILAATSIKNWQFNLGLYHVGKMQWDGKGDLVDSYTRVDASIIKRMPLAGNNELIFKIGAQNLGHSHYYEFRDDLAFEPRYYVGISFAQF